MNDAPRRNLPPDAEAWGRYVDEQLNLLQKRVGIAKKNIVTVSRQSALGQEAAATVTQKTEAVEHVATTALNTAEEKNKADIANYPPPSPKAGDMWYDPADGNDPKIWVDYGPERVNWAHNPGFHHDVTGWVSEGADLLWDGTRKGRLVITNETELFEGTVAFLANDPPLVGEDGPDPNADDKTLDPEEPEKVQPPGHAIPPPPPTPPLDEDDDDTPPDPGIPELGEPFTFSISVEYVGPREGVDVCLAIVVGNEDWYVSDWVTALKGTEERLELNDAPPLVGQAVFQLRVRNGAKEGDQLLVSEAIIEKASEPQGPYFDGYSAGCTQEGDVAVWNGDPRWVSARDNKLLQEALDAANKALEEAREEIAQAKDDLEDQLGRLDIKQIELNANPPSGTANNGDIWWQVDAEDNIIGQWVYLDGVWVESQVRSEVIAELDVGKLRASEAVLDTAVIEKLWAEAIVTKFLTATEQIITEDVIATGAVTAPKITASEELTAKVVRGDMFEGNEFTGGTFTGTTFRTAETGRRWQLDSANGLRGWDDDGVPIFSTDAEGGLVIGSDTTIYTKAAETTPTFASREHQVTAWVPLTEPGAHPVNIRFTPQPSGAGSFAYQLWAEYQTPTGTREVQLDSGRMGPSYWFSVQPEISLVPPQSATSVRIMALFSFSGTTGTVQFNAISVRQPGRGSVSLGGAVAATSGQFNEVRARDLRVTGVNVWSDLPELMVAGPATRPGTEGITTSSGLRKYIYTASDEWEQIWGEYSRPLTTENLNSVTFPALYFQASGGLATTGRNYPTLAGGHLEVLRGAGNNLLQRYTLTDGAAVYQRAGTAGVWQPWAQMWPEVPSVSVRLSNAGTSTFSPQTYTFLGAMSGVSSGTNYGPFTYSTASSTTNGSHLIANVDGLYTIEAWGRYDTAVTGSYLRIQLNGTSVKNLYISSISSPHISHTARLSAGDRMGVQQYFDGSGSRSFRPGQWSGMSMVYHGT